MTRSDDAIAIFKDGYNCAQAVLAAYGPDYGLQREMAFRVSSVFGSGIARTGDMCGAVTGALMVLSLRYCTGKPKGIIPKPVHKKARKFLQQFEKESGTCNCNALRGFDPHIGKYVKGNYSGCEGLVLRACQLLEDLL